MRHHSSLRHASLVVLFGAVSALFTGCGGDAGTTAPPPQMAPPPAAAPGPAPAAKSEPSGSQGVSNEATDSTIHPPKP